MNCQRCKGGKTYEWAERSKLTGGLTVRLCPGCINAWHEYITVQPIFVEMRDLMDRGHDIDVAAYGREEPTAQLAPVRARLREIERELYAISQAWLAGTLATAPVQEG